MLLQSDSIGTGSLAMDICSAMIGKLVQRDKCCFLISLFSHGMSFSAFKMKRVLCRHGCLSFAPTEFQSCRVLEKDWRNETSFSW